jgi:hypothetical protein
MQQLEGQQAAHEPRVGSGAVGVLDGALIGTLDEFAKAVFGQALQPLVEGKRPFPLGLVLGVERLRAYGKKNYRLIWVGRGQAWLAAEDTKEYATKVAVLVAGQRLAESTGAYFDERTR